MTVQQTTYNVDDANGFTVANYAYQSDASHMAWQLDNNGSNPPYTVVPVFLANHEKS
jgi:hypothetical protein